MLIWLKKKNIIKHKKELISYVKIGKLVLTLGNIETEKNEFYHMTLFVNKTISTLLITFIKIIKLGHYI